MSNDRDMIKQEVVLVLGMHRSGTSFVSRFISTLGYNLGDHVMLPSFDNPYGFYENQRVVSFNDKVLKKCRSRWDLPVLSKTDLHIPQVSNFFLEEFEALFESEYIGNEKIVIKDPR